MVAFAALAWRGAVRAVSKRRGIRIEIIVG
jgi:hypothetical protein